MLTLVHVQCSVPELFSTTLFIEGTSVESSNSRQLELPTTGKVVNFVVLL